MLSKPQALTEVLQLSCSVHRTSCSSRPPRCWVSFGQSQLIRPSDAFRGENHGIEELGQQARGLDVGAASRADRHDDANRPLGPIICIDAARNAQTSCRQHHCCDAYIGDHRVHDLGHHRESTRKLKNVFGMGLFQFFGQRLRPLWRHGARYDPLRVEAAVQLGLYHYCLGAGLGAGTAEE